MGHKDFEEKLKSKMKLVPEPESTSVDDASTPSVVSSPTLTQINTPLAEAPELDDAYEILSFMGQGGMGQVYKVKDNVLDKELAIKVMRSDLAADSNYRRRFQQEAESAIAMTHPNIAAVYRQGQTPNGTPFLVMDCVDGKSLDVFLAEHGQLTIAMALDIIHQLVEGVEHAHNKGFVHRDLKPSNIMISDLGDDALAVKILDFGIAKAQDAIRDTQNLTQTGDVFGSPLYMSPEQCLGMHTDARSDIYSIGCILFELLNEEPLFKSANAMQVISKHLGLEPRDIGSQWFAIPEEVRAILDSCLTKEPLGRYQNIAKLKKDIVQCQVGKRIKTRVVSQSSGEILDIGVDVLFYSIGALFAINQFPEMPPMVLGNLDSLIAMLSMQMSYLCMSSVLLGAAGALIWGLKYFGARRNLKLLSRPKSSAVSRLKCYRSIFFASLFTVFAPTWLCLLWTFVGVSLGHADANLTNGILAQSRGFVFNPLLMGMLWPPMFSLFMEMEGTKRKSPKQKQIFKYVLLGFPVVGCSVAILSIEQYLAMAFSYLLAMLIVMGRK